MESDAEQQAEENAREYVCADERCDFHSDSLLIMEDHYRKNGPSHRARIR